MFPDKKLIPMLTNTAGKILYGKIDFVGSQDYFSKNFLKRLRFQQGLHF